jgi:hypothetical protein
MYLLYGKPYRGDWLSDDAVQSGMGCVYSTKRLKWKWLLLKNGGHFYTKGRFCVAYVLTEIMPIISLLLFTRMIPHHAKIRKEKLLASMPNVEINLYSKMQIFIQIYT